MGASTCLRLALGAGVILGLGAACQEYTVGNKPPTAEITDTGDTAAPTPTPEDPPTPPPDAPDIEVDPTQLDFGLLPVQCLSEPEIVTIRNVGLGDLDVNAIFFADGSGAFNHDGQGGFTLASGEEYQFEVDFIGPGLGDWTDRVRVASNDPDESELDVSTVGEAANGGLINDGFTQVSASNVDVLFVLDNSGSMDDNLNALGNQFPIFINNFLALGLDFQIGVVTTDMDDPAQSGQLQGPIISNASADPIGEFVALTSTGSGGSGDERGLDAALTALEPSLGLITTTNAGLVRPGSTLSIIVVSDENDGSDVDPWPFINWLNPYHGSPDRSSLSIVGGPKGGLFPCTSGFFSGVTASPVPRYWTVAQNTGGIHANLCNLSFDQIVQQLSQVAAGLTVSHGLAGVPDDPFGITVTVDGAPLGIDGNNGWTYDAATNSVNFHGAGIPQEGAVVDITYTGELECPVN